MTIHQSNIIVNYDSGRSAVGVALGCLMQGDKEPYNQDTVTGNVISVLPETDAGGSNTTRNSLHFLCYNTEANGVSDIALTRDNSTVYVASFNDTSLRRYDITESKAELIWTVTIGGGSTGSHPMYGYPWDGPRRIKLSNDENYLYVCHPYDGSGNTVCKVDCSDGSIIWEDGAVAPIDYDATDLTVDSNDNVIVVYQADGVHTGHTIFKFDKDGNNLWSGWDTHSAESCYCVEVNANDDIYVGTNFSSGASTPNIVKFDSAGWWQDNYWAMRVQTFMGYETAPVLDIAISRNNEYYVCGGKQGGGAVFAYLNEMGNLNTDLHWYYDAGPQGTHCYRMHLIDPNKIMVSLNQGILSDNVYIFDTFPAASANAIIASYRTTTDYDSNLPVTYGGVIPVVLVKKDQPEVEVGEDCGFFLDHTLPYLDINKVWDSAGNYDGSSQYKSYNSSEPYYAYNYWANDRMQDGVFLPTDDNSGNTLRYNCGDFANCLSRCWPRPFKKWNPTYSVNVYTTSIHAYQWHKDKFYRCIKYHTTDNTEPGTASGAAYWQEVTAPHRKWNSFTGFGGHGQYDESDSAQALVSTTPQYYTLIVKGFTADEDSGVNGIYHLQKQKSRYDGIYVYEQYNPGGTQLYIEYNLAKVNNLNDTDDYLETVLTIDAEFSKGNWSSAENYIVNDVVMHNYQSYKNKQSYSIPPYYEPGVDSAAPYWYVYTSAESLAEIYSFNIRSDDDSAYKGYKFYGAVPDWYDEMDESGYGSATTSIYPGAVKEWTSSGGFSNSAICVYDNTFYECQSASISGTVPTSATAWLACSW